MHRRLLRLSVLMAVVCGTAWVQADIVLPGQKKVRRDTIVHLGPFKDLAPTLYEVQAGDTLSQLAEKHLGSVERQQQITAMNDGLTADTLRAGAKIVMPPRSADMSKWVHFFAVGWGRFAERAFEGQALSHHHYWTELWAVPHEKISDFFSKLERKRRSTIVSEELAAATWIAKAREKMCGYLSMAEGSAINSIRESYTVESIENGAIVLTSHNVQNLDRNEKPVAGAGLFLTAGNGLLVLLAAAGAGGLLLLARRRRAAAVYPEPIPAK